MLFAKSHQVYKLHWLYIIDTRKTQHSMISMSLIVIVMLEEITISLDLPVLEFGVLLLSEVIQMRHGWNSLSMTINTRVGRLSSQEQVSIYT